MVEAFNLVKENYAEDTAFAKIRAKVETDNNITVKGGITDIKRALVQNSISEMFETKEEIVAGAMSLKSITKPQLKKLDMADLF